MWLKRLSINQARLRAAIVGLLVLLQAAPPAFSAEAHDANGMAECRRIASKLFMEVSPEKPKPRPPGRPQDVRNMVQLLTWRASCAEDPPRARGKVVALCEADATTVDGRQRRVFYWENIDGTTTRSGYQWCDFIGTKE